MKLIERIGIWWKGPSWTDKAVVVLTVVIVAVGVAQTVIFRKQWQEMHSGGTDTHDLAIAAKTQADEARIQAGQAKIQADKAIESAEYMDQLAKETLAEARGTNKLAVQAQRSAEYAGQLAKTAEAELATAQSNAKNDQRAWLGVQQTQLESFDVGKRISVIVMLSNTGKSPARHETYVGQIEVLPREARPNFGFDIPDPTWTGVASISPQGSYRLQFATSTLLTQDERDLISHGDRVIWVWGTIHYEDIFDQGHITEFCAFSLDTTSNRQPPSQGMLMYSCPPGNHHDNMD